MKKFYILLFALLFSAGAVYAQNDDELLKKQQQEQQDLLKQQQKEQERLQKQQQKEEERLAKEQAKEQEAAAQKEQDRIKREQAKEQNAIRKEQKKAEKKAKRQENYAKWNRKPSFTADPSATILTDRRFYGQNNYLNAVGYNLGVVIDYHRPIAKRWDCNIGLGYRFTNYYYSHLDAGVVGFDGKEEVRSYSSIVLPLKLSHINKDNDHGWYLGVTPGFNFGFNKSLPTGYSFNLFRCDVAIGTQSRWLIFSPGFEVYFNLLPTYSSNIQNEGKIHEFGIRFNL